MSKPTFLNLRRRLVETKYQDTGTCSLENAPKVGITTLNSALNDEAIYDVDACELRLGRFP